MSDEQVDTSMPPDTTGQEVEPTQTEESAVETETQEPVIEQPVEPQYVAPTPEEIEERAFQRTASWMGRREKEFSDNILRNVTQVIESKLSQFQPTVNASATDPATIFDDPDKWARTVVPRILQEEIGRHTQAAETFNTELVRQSASILDSDPLFDQTTPEGKKFGEAVVKELLEKAGTVDRTLNPRVAAQLLVANAALAVTRRSVPAKGNALSGNKPTSGIGTITAPVRTENRPQPVKLDDMAKKVATWFGNSEKDIQEMLK